MPDNQSLNFKFNKNEKLRNAEQNKKALLGICNEMNNGNQ